MDKVVIILISAGVCCIVVGITLFVKLLSVKPAGTERKHLLAADYEENFNECFENTGNIEDTLDQLADVYMGKQYMHNLIAEAIDYIHDEEGDYETALEKINVDENIEIMKMHNAAIKKAMEKEENVQRENTQAELEVFEEDEEDSEDDKNDDDLDGFKIG